MGCNKESSCVQHERKTRYRAMQQRTRQEETICNSNDTSGYAGLGELWRRMITKVEEGRKAKGKKNLEKKHTKVLDGDAADNTKEASSQDARG